jgi:threonine 3-dehydrogenase
MSTRIKKALITGGNGNLGKLVADRLLGLDVDVVKFDLPGTEPQSLGPGELVVAGDIRDTGLLEKTIEQHQPDTIFHLASLLSGSSEASLQDAWDINATSSFQLMRLAVSGNVRRFFFASTVATYGDVPETVMPQDFEQWPGNMYGATKVAVERLGVYFKLRHGLDFRCLRYPLVISPFAPKTAVTAFPSHAFMAAARDEVFSFPVSPGVGMSTIFIEDVINSIIDFTFADSTTFTRHAYSLHAYYLSAGMVAEQVLRKYPEFQFGFEAVDVVEKLLDNWPDEIDDSDARRDWGWTPKYSFEQSADKMFDLLKNP